MLKGLAEVEEEAGGEVTVLASANSGSKSLRSTVPRGVVKQLNLKEGDRIRWRIEIVRGKIALVVEPVRREQ